MGRLDSHQCRTFPISENQRFRSQYLSILYELKRNTIDAVIAKDIDQRLICLHSESLKFIYGYINITTAPTRRNIINLFPPKDVCKISLVQLRSHVSKTSESNPTRQVIKLNTRQILGTFLKSKVEPLRCSFSSSYSRPLHKSSLYFFWLNSSSLNFLWLKSSWLN